MWLTTAEASPKCQVFISPTLDFSFATPYIWNHNSMDSDLLNRVTHFSLTHRWFSAIEILCIDLPIPASNGDNMNPGLVVYSLL